MAAWLRALLGIAFGGGLLWLALSQIDMDAVGTALLGADPAYLIAALALYWGDVALRISRWRLLLVPTKRLTYPQVARALIVGYAVNNVLPARLGEIFRADFVRRQFAVPRSAALGSIVIERMLDGLTVVGLFGTGLMLATLQPGQTVLIAVAVAGAIGTLGGIAAIFGVLFFHERLPLHRWPWLKTRVAAMAGSLSVVHGPEIVQALLFTVVIWALECGAFYLVVATCGVSVSLTGLCLIVGAASLSTLLPSAPGYIGSFQIAFVLAFAALSLDAAPAVVAATLTQITLLGSMTVAGLALLAGTYVGDLKTSPRD